MNYFGFLKRPRQAVFVLTTLLIFAFSAHIFAQEAKEIEQTIKAADTVQTTNETETTTTNDAPKSTAARLTAKNFAAASEPEKRKFRDFSLSTKTETKQQSQPDDDTMMGVMGKGADNIKLGGHVGFVVPIVARGNGRTTNVGDRFVFGFPVGLTLKTKRHIAIDFEFIPTFNTGRDFVLTIHPGIIYGFAKKYAVGVRAAYDAGAGSYGFTPLVSRGFKINEKVGFFIEADFPIRSNYRAFGDRFGSIAFAAHAGFAF